MASAMVARIGPGSVAQSLRALTGASPANTVTALSSSGNPRSTCSGGHGLRSGLSAMQ
jgi:hypothetical protein